MERMRKIINFHSFDDVLERGWPSEEAIVGTTIAFMNGATIRVGGLEHVESENEVRIFESSIEVLARLFDNIRNLESLHNIGLLQAEADQISSATVDRESRYRALMRGIFCAFVQNPADTVGQFFKQGITSKLEGNTYLCPTRDGGMSIVHYYDLGDYTEIVGVGKALLLDPAKGFGKRLCQCHLSTCRKFFFEVKPPKGRPQRKYCCADHMTKAHEANAANRMKTSREKKRLNKSRKKK